MRVFLVLCLAALVTNGIPLFAARDFFLTVSVRTSANANWCPHMSQLLAGCRIQVGVTVPTVVVVVHVTPYIARHTYLSDPLTLVPVS